MAPMMNICTLLSHLRENNWHITAFSFSYNNADYIVLFEDIANLPLSAKEYVVLLTFIDRANENRVLQTKANQFSFEINAKAFREYFHIKYQPNLRDIFKQFYAFFNNFVPTSRITTIDAQTKSAIVNRLSHNDNESVNNLCCYAAKRNGIHNGKQYHRSPFNSDKTKLLREDLFNMLGDDDTISFCYRETDALNDLEIYKQFEKRYGIRVK